jgi:hypothetical protein
MCHLRRSFLDLRGQGDPDFTIICEGAALILISEGTAAAIYHLSDPQAVIASGSNERPILADTVEKLGTWAEVTLRVKH